LNVAKLSGVDEDEDNKKLPLELYADGQFSPQLEALGLTNSQFILFKY